MQNRTQVNFGTPEFGHLFESYIFHELRTFIDYKLLDQNALSFWRSTSGFEVDFVLNEETAIEIKATKNISSSDLKGLYALREENKLKKYVVVCFEERPRKIDFIDILPWRMFLEKLWENKL